MGAIIFVYGFLVSCSLWDATHNRIDPLHLVDKEVLPHDILYGEVMEGSPMFTENVVNRSAWIDSEGKSWRMKDDTIQRGPDFDVSVLIRKMEKIPRSNSLEDCSMKNRGRFLMGQIKARFYFFSYDDEKIDLDVSEFGARQCNRDIAALSLVSEMEELIGK